MSSLEAEISLMLYNITISKAMLECAIFYYAVIIIEMFYLLFIIHHKHSNIKIN